MPELSFNQLAKEKEIAEAKAKAEAEKQAKIEEARIEKEKIKAEKEEAARKAKEEKLKAKLEAEEAARKAKEEKQAKIEAAEAAKKAKEEQDRLDAEIKKLEMEEKAKAALAEKEEAERQAKLKSEEAAKKSKAEKDEQLRKAKEEVFGKNRIKESVAVKGYSSDDDIKLIDDDTETLYIEGRVLKGKVGVKGVQVRLLLSDEEKIFLTDKNGYYKIPELDKGKNYLITVLSGKETLNLSPKSRTYKNLSTNMKKQNFYVVEKAKVEKPKKVEKDTNTETQDWNSKYGIVNKNGVIQKDIHW